MKRKNDQIKKSRSQKQDYVTKKESKRMSDKREKKEARRGNVQIMFLTYFVFLLFIGMAGYLGYFTLTQSARVVNNSHNPRQELLASRVVKGSIVSADGEVLAETVTDGAGKEYRGYPFGPMFCHVVGRSDKSLTGIELTECYPLLTSHINPFSQLANTFQGKKNPGDDVITTLDTSLQKTAYRALKEYRGAAVAIEPETGKILAMVSTPSYDPNDVTSQWEQLTSYSKENSRLINRATQGLYTPGSIFKMVTAMEYLAENPKEYKDYQYRCKGSEVFGESEINCYHKEVHGKVDLVESFAESCNGSFANIGTLLDLSSYRKLCQKLMFNRKLDVDFECNASKFSLTKRSSTSEVTETAMGQGKTLITPIHAAMLSAMVANDGVMMKPYVVDRVETKTKSVVQKTQPKEVGQVIDGWTASQMQTLMEEVVKQGTATQLKGQSYKAAGKTGSAEIDSKGTTNAWFTGYAKYKGKQIAVAVVVEGAGTGSRYAVPIARKMFDAYFQ